MPDLKVANEVLRDVPFGKSFAGHETFVSCRAWLKKGVVLLDKLW